MVGSHGLQGDYLGRSPCSCHFDNTPLPCKVLSVIVGNDVVSNIIITIIAPALCSRFIAACHSIRHAYQLLNLLLIESCVCEERLCHQPVRNRGSILLLF